MPTPYAALLLVLLVLSFFIRDIYAWLFAQTLDWYRPYFLWVFLIVLSVFIRGKGNKL